MSYVVTSEREAPSVRYEKVGRLRPGENNIVEVIRDGSGVIVSIPASDIILALNGLSTPGFLVSESGKRMEITGDDGKGYFVLEQQVRGMIRDWPKGKAALFVIGLLIIFSNEYLWLHLHS